jgi:hypothetical protein
MSRPVKDRSTVAGVPRTRGAAVAVSSRPASPTRGNNAEESEVAQPINIPFITTDLKQDVNHDECAACGEPGRLVCCDGCENSFHFTCCDPPLEDSPDALEDPYFCFECQADRGELAEPTSGVLGRLADDLQATNTASFQLPNSVQNYFDGVTCKENGEYHDLSEPRVPMYVLFLSSKFIF